MLVQLAVRAQVLSGTELVGPVACKAGASKLWLLLLAVASSFPSDSNGRAVGTGMSLRSAVLRNLRHRPGKCRGQPGYLDVPKHSLEFL